MKDVRHLEPLGARDEPVAQRCRVDTGAGARDDDGVNGFAEPLIRHAGAERCGDVGMPGEEILDLERRDFVAAAQR